MSITICMAMMMAVATNVATPAEMPDVKSWHGANLLGLFNAAPQKPDARVCGKFNECYFRWMKEWGFNFVRLPMDYRFFLATNDWSKFKPEGFAKVDEAVAWGRKYGIHVQICLHRAPGFTILSWIPEKTHLQTDREPQEAFMRIWSEFARRYRGIPNSQLTFNLINEPNGFSEEQFIDVFGRTIDAIRAVDPGRFVMLDGNRVASTPVPHFYKVPLTGQAFRGYRPHAISHYQAWYIKEQPEVEPTWPFSPEMAARKLWIYTQPEKALEQFAEPRKIGYPVMIGEFGCYNKLRHETCLAWMEHCLKLWQREGLGWAIWNVDGSFGFMDSNRADVEYEDFEGHKLDRKMLELLRRYAQPTAAASSLRVGSYNIRNSFSDRKTQNAWTNRCADLVALVKRLNLDVFGMQEVCPDQAAYLRGQLPEFALIGDHREKDRVSGEASPVGYRKSRFVAEKSGNFWLSETPEIPASKSWGTACTRICSYLILREKATGKRFCFANTHTDHVSAEAREKGMLLIIQRMKEFGKGAPIVFTGDHNCSHDDPPAKAVRKILKDARDITETPCRGPHNTFNGFGKRKDGPFLRNGVLTDYCIDYIYVSDGIRVRDFTTCNDHCAEADRYPSDHFPIVSTIEL